MILRKLSEKPDVFSHLVHEREVYYAIHMGGEVIGYFSLNYNFKPHCIIHLEMTRFSHRVLRYGVDVVWPEIVNEIKAYGCDVIIADTAGNLETKKKFQQFCAHFGFNGFFEHITSLQRI
jgi:hypothetical protein